MKTCRNLLLAEIDDVIRKKFGDSLILVPVYVQVADLNLSNYM